jgi:transposase
LPTFVAVGIDGSDRDQVICAEADGVAPRLRLKIGHDLAAFQRLLDTLRETYGELPCYFALENPASLLARFLVHAGYTVYALNPRSVARMREALATSGKKDDPLDAEALCLLVRRRADDLAPVGLGSAEGRMLAGLVRQRVDGVGEKTRLLNQLTAALKGYYPRALELFPKLEQPLTRAFLKAFSSPAALAEATEAQWQVLFRGQRYPQPARIATLWEQARQPQVPVSPIDEALGARLVQRLLRSLEVVLEELRSLEEEIETRFAALPDAKIFGSAPGAGAALAPALFTLFGDDRARWSEWRALACNSGSVPVTRRSGGSCAVNMRYHCDHEARRTLFLFARCSLRKCAWARQFYAEQRRRGKGYGTALRNLGTKWLRILFRMWQEQTPYDEAKYLKRQAERQAPRAAAASGAAD